MTKLAILADIHGVWPALESVLQDLGQFNPDRIIVVGDLINLGPFSRQVVIHAVENDWVVVRGNNELALLDYDTPRAPDQWQDLTQFAMLGWLDRQIDDDLKDTIGAWPDTLQLRFRDAPPIRLVHGSARSSIEPIYRTATDKEIEDLLAGTAEHVVVAGHTHLPMQRTSGKWRILNPGSVGMPLDGDGSASYMLLEGDRNGWHPTFRRVCFDYTPVFREFERQGFVEECGVIGYLVVETLRTARPQVTPFLKWRDQLYPDEPLSTEMLQEYAESAAWEEYTHPAYQVGRATTWQARSCQRQATTETMPTSSTYSIKVEP
jgi:predicted phosphodiesterase